MWLSFSHDLELKWWIWSEKEHLSFYTLTVEFQIQASFHVNELVHCTCTFHEHELEGLIFL